jgi:hypothetical protein
LDTNLKPSGRLVSWFRKRRREDAIAEAKAVLSLSVSPKQGHNKRGSVASASITQRAFSNGGVDNEKGDEKFLRFNQDQVTGVYGRALLQSENHASWLLLLQRMFFVYRWCQRAKTPNTTYQARKETSASVAPERSAPENTVHTEGGIQFVEWVWDTMPNDVSKPLATTTLGTLIAFTVRLGMQWRTLNGVNSEDLLCDGEGYALTFTEIPSVGLIAKFRDTGRRNREPLVQFTPGRATDKLMFGIIPGARHLVDQDIWCVGQDRNTHVMPSICKRVSRDDKLFKLRNDNRKFWETKNEAISFLCEFLPVSGSQCTVHSFWGWETGRQSVVKYYEGRLALWRHLKRLQDKGSLNDDTLVPVCEHLSYLQNTYKNDAFGINHLRAAAANDTSTGDRLQMQANLIQDCRSIFDWTTHWFIEHGFSASSPRDSGSQVRTIYMHLVAAHIWMGSHAVPVGQEKTRVNRTMSRWNERKYDYYKLNDERYGIPIPYQYFDPHLYNIAEAYIEFLKHDEHGVVKYMRDQDLGISDDIVEGAWWVMILRGIAWTLPTVEERRGDAIPSMYDSLCLT